MELWLIKKNFNNDMIVDQLEIIKETEKTFKLDKNNAYISVLNKNDINRVNTTTRPYVISTSVEKGIELLITYCNRMLTRAREQIDRIESDINQLKELRK